MYDFIVLFCVLFSALSMCFVVGQVKKILKILEPDE